MKNPNKMEKTFDELIKEKLKVGEQVYFEQIFELLQQVREATIAECRDIALQDDIIIVGDITTRIERLPTDRITITDK